MGQTNLEGFTLSKEEQIQFLKFKLRHQRAKEYKPCRCGRQMLNRSWNVLCADCEFKLSQEVIGIPEIKLVP